MENKTKRQKQVFKTYSELAHIWAANTQEKGRTSGRMFFEGDSIYSYGYHYTIAKRHFFNSKEVILVNSSGYSKTTAKHTREVENAINHITNFKVPNIREVKSQDNVNYLMDNVIDALNILYTARTGFFCSWSDKGEDSSFNRKYFNQAVKTYNEYCETFNIDQKLELSDDFKQEIDDLVQYMGTKEQQKQLVKDALRKELSKLSYEERRALKQSKTLEKQEKVLKAWRNGAGTRPKFGIFLRVKENLVETSKGASVPLDQAIRLMQQIVTNTAETNTKIGHYIFNKANKENIVIGCHTIPMLEAKSVLEKYYKGELFVKEKLGLIEELL